MTEQPLTVGSAAYFDALASWVVSAERLQLLEAVRREHGLDAWTEDHAAAWAREREAEATAWARLDAAQPDPQYPKVLGRTHRQDAEDALPPLEGRART